MSDTETTTTPQSVQDKHPDAWIATEIGDSITGKLVGVSFAWSDQRKQDYPVLTIMVAGGTEKKVHCFGNVLYNEVKRQRPMPGEKITIAYLGVGEPKVRGQNGAKRYSFRIDGRGAAATQDMYDRAFGGNGPRHQDGPTQGQQSAEAPPTTAEPVDEDIPF